MTVGSVKETNPQSARFQWVAAPMAAPGSCGICGKSKHDKGFVTTQLNFEFYGDLIFCCDCALNLGAPVGGLTPGEYQDLVEDNAILHERLTEALSRIEALETIENAIRHYNFNNGSSDRSSDPVRELVQPEELNGTVEVPTEPEPLPDEPVIEQGPDDSSDVTDSNSPDSILAELGIS